MSGEEKRELEKIVYVFDVDIQRPSNFTRQDFQDKLMGECGKQITHLCDELEAKGVFKLPKLTGADRVFDALVVKPVARLYNYLARKNYELSAYIPIL